MKRWLHSLFSATAQDEILVMYFGRASEFLLMTSERMSVPQEGYTMHQVLGRLRSRGERWAYELDTRHLVCIVDGKPALGMAHIKPGMEIAIHSRKSIFEP